MGKRVQAGVNDLATINPTLTSQWHPTKNGELTPKEVMAGSDRKVWWWGDCGHEWEASITSRNGNRTGCPFCSGHRTLAGFNDLETVNPTLAAEWHPTKNGDLTSAQVSPNTHRKIWWITDCGHEWDVSVSDRHSNNQGCPICCGRRVLIGFNDLSTTNPSLAAQWHPTANGELTPQQVIAGSGKKVWWLGKCNHEWDATLNNRNKDSGCPVCAGIRVQSGINDLATTNPVLASQWHPTKNGKLTPQQVIAGGTRKVWWLGECGHEWNNLIENRVRQGLNCPYCSGQRVLTGFNDLQTTHPKLAFQWHPTKNGNQSVTQVSKGSKKKVWWRGVSCGHEWDAVVMDRKVTQKCPICTGKRVLTGFNDLGTTHPTVAAEWHPTKNGDLSFLQVSAGSNKKVWWRGVSCGHEWNAVIASRGLSGCGCSTCANSVSKAELEIRKYLEELGLSIEGSDRTILKPYEIDLWIPEKKIGIEFNGIYWHSEKWRERDYHYNKWLASKEAGIKLIQIWENDWISDPDRVLRSLRSKMMDNSSTLTEIISLSSTQAISFLQKNSYQEPQTGSHYFGLVDKVNALQAVLALNLQTDKQVLIVQFAALSNSESYFKRLLDHILDLFKPELVQGWTDNCHAEKIMYEDNGFVVGNCLPPDYKYVKQQKCESKTDYPLERFRDDVELLWEEGLSEMQLADLNGMVRIWDAGKTLYVLNPN